LELQLNLLNLVQRISYSYNWLYAYLKRRSSLLYSLLGAMTWKDSDAMRCGSGSRSTHSQPQLHTRRGVVRFRSSGTEVTAVLVIDLGGLAAYIYTVPGCPASIAVQHCLPA